jgi:hypothetical protein
MVAIEQRLARARAEPTRAQSIERVDRIVNRMVKQRVPKRRDPFL